MIAARRFAGRRRGLIRAVVSIAVGGVLLFFVLRAIRTADLVETLSDLKPGLAVLAAIGAFSFIAADNLSGVASTSVPSPLTVTAEGPSATGTVVNISTEPQLQAAMQALTSNMTIVIAPGTSGSSRSRRRWSCPTRRVPASSPAAPAAGRWTGRRAAFRLTTTAS